MAEKCQTNAAASVFMDLSERFAFADMLSIETVEALYPYIRQARDEDLAGNEELSTLCAMMRAHLQHFDISVEL